MGPQIKAVPDPLHHGFGDGNLHDAIGASALGVDDDPGLVVHEIVGIVSKKRVDALPGDPCRLWISQRDLFGRFASTVAAARSTTISVAMLLMGMGGIENREILANRTGCLLRFRPGDGLITRHSFLLVHVCPD